MTVEVTTLDNGLRVVTAAMPHVETVSLGVWVGAGTRDERPEVNGVAHMLEHMAFKGTRRRSARGIAEEIEAVGGHLNAYTSRDSTAYYAKVLKVDLPLAVDLIADILLHSVYDEGELRRERDVVLQEIGQAADTPDDIVFDHLQAAAYPDQPVGWPVLGTTQTVRSMPRDALIDFVGHQYGAERTVVAAAGNLDHGHVVELATEAFGALECRGAPERAPAEYHGGDLREPRSLEQVHLTLGFPGVAYDDPDHYALAMYATMVGGGMSSRLFQELREERGLVYSVYSFAGSMTDGGMFGVYAGTGEAEVSALVPVVFDQLRDTALEPRPGELERARSQLKAGVVMALESTSARAEQLANQMLVFGHPLPIEEIVAKIEAVDQDAVARVAERVLSGPLTCAAVGPLGRLESYDDMAARLA